jgi:hypothetical protein
MPRNAMNSDNRAYEMADWLALSDDEIARTRMNRNGVNTPSCQTPIEGTALRINRPNINDMKSHLSCGVFLGIQPNSGIQSTTPIQKRRRTELSAELDENTSINRPQTLTLQLGTMLETEYQSDLVSDKSL